MGETYGTYVDDDRFGIHDDDDTDHNTDDGTEADTDDDTDTDDPDDGRRGKNDQPYGMAIPRFL